MKKFFISMLAVAALVGCAKEETIVADQGAPIGFSTFVENATRVDYSNSETPLEEFNIYGTVSGTVNGGGTVNIFDGDQVTGEVGYQDADPTKPNIWTCTETQYWIPGADYAFAAVVDATIGADDVDDYGMPTELHTIADPAITGNMHLLDMLYDEKTVAGTNVTANYDTPVNFTFQHLLSKVHFTVTSTAQGDYYHKVREIKVYNFASGTYTLSTSSWAGETSTPVSFAGIDKVSSANTDGVANADKLLVPTANSFMVEFIVDLYKGTTLLGTTTYKDGDADTTNNAIEVTTDLVKGNAYNFTINCSVGNPITFTVTNDPQWTTDNNDVSVL